MIEKLQKIIFLLIIFSLSSQVGLHLWPNFSYIFGVRVDYLSPTIHLLDILIVFWIILHVGNVKIRIESPIPKAVFALFMASLVINVFISKSPLAHIFGIVKLAEFGLFGLLAATTFSKDYIRPFILTIAASASLSSILSIWQFAKQSSVGGLWYFFGERSFNASTIGISTVNLNEQLLRPYGAFPHPNVLAFFLLMTIIFSIIRIPYEKKTYGRSFLIFLTILSSTALILTFSRVSIFLFILFLFYVIYTKGKTNARYYLFGMLGLFIFLLFRLPTILSVEFLFRGIDFRQELLIQSFTILSSNLYFGIGLSNFFVHQAPLIETISPIIFQPPHNIFVLALLSLGLLGFWIFPYIFYLSHSSLFAKLQTTKGKLKDFHKSVLFILLAIIIVGMFDHFFLTLEQGQIMLALILGLSFSRLKI